MNLTRRAPVKSTFYAGIAVNADEDEFRTCFTLWSYDGSTDRFFIGEEEVSVEAFERKLGFGSLDGPDYFRIFHPSFRTQRLQTVFIG